MRSFILYTCIAILLCACAKPEPHIVNTQEPLEEIQPRLEETRESGSLWQPQNGSMFSDQKARDIGDIVTVIISEKSSATKEATTSTDRTSAMSASIPHFFGLENNKYWTDNQIDLQNLVQADFSNNFAGSGSTSRKEDLTASITTQVISRYPNGQLKIRGGKEVMVNNEIQIIYLTGIIRPVDITSANTVSSTKVLNARISYTGKGAISDKQNPGWAMRILDFVWPF
jgi:flagellar L-ring protein precursor FlgH